MNRPTSLSEILGQQLVTARKRSKFTQRDAAVRVQRTPSRIAELEGDLLQRRHRRDRLELLLDLCHALNLVPVLVPKSRSTEVERLLGYKEPPRYQPIRSTFDEVYVDLSDDEDED